MLATRSRTSDAVMIVVGIVIFLVLILGVFLFVRRQPQIPAQSPGTPSSAAPSVSEEPRRASA
jgi:hypothetical protein